MLRKTTFYILLTFISEFLYSQDIKSLKKNASSTVDSIRFTAYSDLVWELKDLNKTEALLYANKLIKEAETKGDKKWIAQGYNNIGIVNLKSGNLDVAVKE